MVDRFNDYFVNVGPNPDNKTASESCSHLDYMNIYNNNNMFVLPVTPSEICDVTSTFKFNKSAGYDSVSVPPIAVADAAPVYSRIILYEVNSLYSVTLYCCDPSLCCTCIERTAYRGDIFILTRLTDVNKPQVHWMLPV